MGTYTQMHLDVHLKYDKSLLAALLYLQDIDPNEADPEDIGYPELLSIPLFNVDRFHQVLADYGAFDGCHKAIITIYFDENYNRIIHLVSGSNSKNYDNQYELFLDYLGPYILDTGKIGIYQTEMSDRPSDIIFENGEFTFKYQNDDDDDDDDYY